MDAAIGESYADVRRLVEAGDYEGAASVIAGMGTVSGDYLGGVLAAGLESMSGKADPVAGIPSSIRRRLSPKQLELIRLAVRETR